MNKDRERNDDTPTEVPMSLEQIGKMVRKIDRALSGNPYDSQEPGFLSIMTELHRDYYGDKKTGRTGTKEMILKLWDNNRKVIGACVVLGFAGSLIGWAVEQLILSRH